MRGYCFSGAVFAPDQGEGFLELYFLHGVVGVASEP